MESKMTDYISREAAIKEFETSGSIFVYGVKQCEDIIGRLEAIPVADVREVVYCEDCYAYRKDKELAEAAYLDGEKYCALIRCEMPEDGFCWYGKRICGADMREEQT